MIKQGLYTHTSIRPILSGRTVPLKYIACLKVPKSEIFDLMDSRDFYTIKPPWVCDFGTVNKKFEIISFSS
jgi:hypothetical protein